MPFIDKSPLSYMPNTATPIRRYALDRAPTTSDYRSFKVGDEWLDTSSIDWWKLCDKDTTSGTWKKMAGTGGPVETFPVDSGTSPVIPNAANEVTLAGGTGITTVGSLNTVTFDLDADIAQQYTADAGSAVPAANNLNVLGGTGLNTTGVGDTVTVNADGAIANQYVTDAGTAVPVLNSLNVLGGTGLDTTGVGDTVTVNASGELANQYTTDAGTAAPVANNLDVLGGTGIDTSGVGDTVTINASAEIANQYTTDAGTAIPVANNLDVLGGTGIDTAGVGDTVTINATSTTLLQVTADAGTATPALNNLNAFGGTGVTTSAAGSTLTITASATGLAWVNATGATQAMVEDTAYGANNAGGVTFTLPATATEGSVIEVIGIQGLWSLAQNAGQTVYSGAFNTTTGVGGSLTALNAGDCIVLRCIVADTDFRVQNMVGNLTIV